MPKRILLSMALIAACGLSAVTLRDVLEGHSLYMFMAAVMVCSLYGGMVVAVLSSVLAVLVHSFFFQRPLYHLSIATHEDRFELVMFLSVATIVCWIGASYRKALAQVEAARQREEFEKRSREDVIAIVSHDLKNPLAAIQMNAQILEKLGPSLGEGDLKRRTAAIRESVRQMSRLIQDLLDFEKIRAGTFEICRQEQRLGLVVVEVCRVLRALAEAKEISLTTSIEPNDVEAWFDAARVSQVISNILGNAIKFTPRGGSIALRVRLEDAESAWVRIDVRDNGPGIAAEHLDHVFDRYWQGARTARQGTGLGLAISRGIVLAHGGRIWVESQLGKGSTFSFRLPRRPLGLPQRQNDAGPITRAM